MALNTDPNNLRDEVRAAGEFRDAHLKRVDKLVRRLTTRFYATDHGPGHAVVENHAYEFLSIMLPQIVYDAPKVVVKATDPTVMDDFGMWSMGDFATGLQLSLNRWAADSAISGPLLAMALDFYFSYAVGFVAIADQPGFQGYEMVPQQPYLVHLQPKHFVIDPKAMDSDPMAANGPRFMGHMWKADQEDLLSDAAFDPDAVGALVVDSDLDDYDSVRAMSDLNAPNRKEIVAWDIWVPDDQRTDEPGYHGSIHTVAVLNSQDGVSKRARAIRPPTPAYCPPWGPYVMWGYMPVPGRPFPLSPLVATAEQAEEVDEHMRAAATDAKSYKRVVAGQNSADAERIKSAPHGHVVLLDDPQSIKQVELGGVSETQYKYNQYARDRLNRLSGVSDAMRGERGEGDVTATEASIMQSGGQVRINWMRRRFKAGVKRLMETAAWYIFHGDDMRFNIGDEGQRHGIFEFTGGLMGREAFRFFDLSLSIEPYSMEHTDAAVLQRRIQTAFEMLTKTAPTMPQTPWVNWREPIKAMFESVNIEDADDWVDFEMAKRVGEMQMGLGQQPAGTMGPQPAGGQYPGIDVARETGQIVSQ